MSILSNFLLDLLTELFNPDQSDPFDGMGEPYFRDALMSDDDYRNYIWSHNANQLGSGAFNSRTGMWDDGFDSAGIYAENDWVPGPVGIYDDD